MWDEAGQLHMDLSRGEVDGWLERQQQQVSRIVAQRQALLSAGMERRAHLEERRWRQRQEQ